MNSITRDSVPWWAVTFAATIAVYLLALSRDVGTFDIAEMQTIPHVFGVAHPTGYPLYTILGGIWSHIPFGSVAIRMNLLSAVLLATAAAVCCAVAVRLRVRGPIACGAALVVGFATGTWRNALHAEVQSLHLLLLATVILLWIAACDDPTPRKVALRESTAPLLNANPERSWWGKVRGDGFRGSLGQLRSLHVWADAIGPQLRLISGWVGIVVLFLALLGVGSLARRAARTTVGLVAIGLLASYAQANSTDSNDRYVLGTVLVVALFAAVGAEALATAVADQFSGRAATIAALPAVLLFALLPLNGLRANYRALDAHRSHHNEDNGKAVLNALPTNCVLWAYWDLRTQLFYLRYIEGVRPDVTILDHRSTRNVGSSFAASPEGVYQAVTKDPRYTGRPVCFVPFPGQRASAGKVQAWTIAETDRPWGIGYLNRGRVYVLTASP